MDFLGDHPTSDYNITELAAKSGVTRQTVYRVLGGLQRVGMVNQTRHVGQSPMYAVNMEHPVVQSVLQADMAAAADAVGWA